MDNKTVIKLLTELLEEVRQLREIIELARDNRNYGLNVKVTNG